MEHSHNFGCLLQWTKFHYSDRIQCKRINVASSFTIHNWCLWFSIKTKENLMEQYNEPMEPNMETPIQEHVILELVAPLRCMKNWLVNNSQHHDSYIPPNKNNHLSNFQILSLFKLGDEPQSFNKLVQCETWCKTMEMEMNLIAKKPFLIIYHNYIGNNHCPIDCFTHWEVLKLGCTHMPSFNDLGYFYLANFKNMLVSKCHLT
jgi:hypothetical protein